MFRGPRILGGWFNSAGRVYGPNCNKSAPYAAKIMIFSKTRIAGNETTVIFTGAHYYFVTQFYGIIAVAERVEELDRYGVYEYEQDGQKVINIARYGTMPEARPATDAEKAAILGALAWCREKFEKRLDAYLKRWGTSKLRFGTYWADR